MTELFLATQQPLSEKLAIGAEVAIMGILIVFSVLAIIWGALEIFRVIFYELPKKKAEKQAAKAAVEVTTAGPTVIEEEPVQNVRDEGEILAAITAAIALMTEKQPSSFRVVSFRRVENGKSRRH